MLDMEIIISANGCTDGTKEYLESITDSNFHCVWSDESLGYTKALNEGIKVSTGEFLIYLNNDIELLPQELDTWIKQLLIPFDDPTVGASGPLILYDRYADVQTLIFFCAMVRRSLIDIIGLPDEIYSPGGGEDIDFCAKAQLAGYKIVQVPVEGQLEFTHTNVGGFPIWHKDNQTFKDIPEYTNWIVKRNGLLNAKRYNKHIKLNLGSGGIHIPGYLSVDNFDPRTHILMDATKLDFEDNTVEEIIASHLFEHINPYKAVDTLKEWLRVLKPGGKLIMEMPDFESLCYAFLESTKEERYGFLNCVYGTVNTTEEGSPDQITAPHLWGWYPAMLDDHLQWAGYENVTFMNEKIPHPGYNFRVEATKPI
jgi:GT2 family glycosyltransferase